MEIYAVFVVHVLVTFVLSAHAHNMPMRDRKPPNTTSDPGGNFVARRLVSPLSNRSWSAIRDRQCQRYKAVEEPKVGAREMIRVPQGILVIV